MRYLLACVHSWWWHLTYGMWMGYRETRTYVHRDDATGWKCLGRDLVALTSTDSEFRIVKVFYEHGDAAHGESKETK